MTDIRQTIMQKLLIEDCKMNLERNIYCLEIHWWFEKKVQGGRDLDNEKLIAGHAPPLKLMKYGQADERLKVTVSTFERRNEEYQRGNAHNFSYISTVVFFN